jgi:hypothetical protein
VLEYPVPALRDIPLLRSRWVKELAPAVARQLQVIFADLSTEEIQDDPARMEALAEAIEIRLARHRLQSATEERRRLRELFKGEPLELPDLWTTS